jgi:hypothetical protein
MIRNKGPTGQLKTGISKGGISYFSNSIKKEYLVLVLRKLLTNTFTINLKMCQVILGGYKECY